MPTSTDIVVNKLLKHHNKIITIKKLKDIIENVLGDNFSKSKIYKTIHTLKNRGYIITLKKNIFFIKRQDKEYQEDYLVDKYYRTVLQQHCKDFIYSKRYIGGLKALQLNINDFSIPEEITIINESKQSIETVIFDKQVLLKTYSTSKTPLFKFFNKLTHKIKIGTYIFPVANMELSILESLYNPSVITEGYTKELVKKILKKRKKYLNYKTREDILKKNKHNSSLNRLYHLSQQIDSEISEKIKNIIKKYGYFVSI